MMVQSAALQCSPRTKSDELHARIHHQSLCPVEHEYRHVVFTNGVGATGCVRCNIGWYAGGDGVLLQLPDGYATKCRADYLRELWPWKG